MEQSVIQNMERPVDTSKKLKLKEKIAYGMGDVGNNFLFDLGQIYLLKFYTDALGLPSATAGLIFLITKIWDAFADITVGTWVDNRKKLVQKESSGRLSFTRQYR